MAGTETFVLVCQPELPLLEQKPEVADGAESGKKL
jgi:hypothetical protein